jgi:hypothetical protein
MPQPAVNAPPAPPDDSDVLPARNTAELGVLFGTLWVSDNNNLADKGKPPAEYGSPVWQLGARAAFFPEKVFGIEAEFAHGFAQWGCGHAYQCEIAPGAEGGPFGGSAGFNSLRGHLIGQLPTSRFVPFALLGAGMLHVKSDGVGSDTDFLFELGAGAKVMATKLIVPRVDFRLGMTQKRGGGFTDGVAVHPEISIGLGFTLGR